MYAEQNVICFFLFLETMILIWKLVEFFFLCLIFRAYLADILSVFIGPTISFWQIFSTI